MTASRIPWGNFVEKFCFDDSAHNYMTSVGDNDIM